MPQTEPTETGSRNDLRRAINTLIFPAMNVLRGIELDLHEHPDCPYRELAAKAVANLATLMELANGTAAKNHEEG